MLGIYILITAAVIAAGCVVVAKMSEVYDDFLTHYRDYNRYIDYRS